MLRGAFLLAELLGAEHSQAGLIKGEDTMTAVENADEAQRYDPRDIQDKWQARWAEIEPFRADDDPADPRERYYLVDMFPYPSGDLHMGHAEAYAIGDAMARYWFLRGQPERVPPDRMQHVLPAQEPVPGHRVADRVGLGVPHVQVAGGVREHV